MTIRNSYDCPNHSRKYNNLAMHMYPYNSPHNSRVPNPTKIYTKIALSTKKVYQYFI